MPVERPDLSRVDPEVRSYIESIEAELESLRTRRTGRHPIGSNPDDQEERPLLPVEFTEPPTSLNLITITKAGLAKRTPRHHYTRQRRGGMGVFDLDVQGEDFPALLVVADESQSLLLFTNLGRAFRMPVSSIPEGPVHSRGKSIIGRLGLQPEEHLEAALPDLVKGSVAMVSELGMVRSLRHHVFGEYMKQGTNLFDMRSFGPLAAACWTPGDGDLFIATRSGRGIRFSEKLLHPQGSPGIRVEEDDPPAGIAAVYQDSGVFMVGADGRGTIRQMEGFNPNKSTGGSGKTAMNINNMVGAVTVSDKDDIFLISRLGKLIRFSAEDVPSKEGVVQGVNCMALRADNVVALTASQAPR
jgi:DNA gyrase subunit A